MLTVSWLLVPQLIWKIDVHIGLYSGHIVSLVIPTNEVRFQFGFQIRTRAVDFNLVITLFFKWEYKWAFLTRVPSWLWRIGLARNCFLFLKKSNYHPLKLSLQDIPEHKRTQSDNSFGNYWYYYIGAISSRTCAWKSGTKTVLSFLQILVTAI